MGNDSYLVAAAKRFSEVVEKRRRAYYRFKMEQQLSASARARKKEEDLRLKAVREEIGHNHCARSVAAAREGAFPPSALFQNGEGGEEDEQEDEEEGGLEDGDEELNSDSDADEVGVVCVVHAKATHIAALTPPPHMQRSPSRWAWRTCPRCPAARRSRGRWCRTTRGGGST